jgi:hypothetical protein
VVAKTLSSVTTFLWSLIALFVIGGIVLGGFYFVKVRYADQFALEDAQEELENTRQELEGTRLELAEEKEENAVLRTENERLLLSNRLLKADHQIAYIEVINQEGSDETEDLLTEFRFVEIDDQGAPCGEPREFQIEGNHIYIDGRVIKFKDELIETGDPLRSTSIFVFDRLFSDKMTPEEGFIIDDQNAGPIIYRSGGEPSQFEKDLWKRFWEFSSNPDMMAEEGIRAAHGTAQHTPLQPGIRYIIQLRASDGLTIRPESNSEPDPDGGPTT